MTFNNLRRFNNTLTQIIIQFNKNQEPCNNFICIDNCKAINNPDNSDGSGVTSSAIASVLSGHFDTNPVRKEEGVRSEA